MKFCACLRVQKKRECAKQNTIYEFFSIEGTQGERKKGGHLKCNFLANVNRILPLQTACSTDVLR